MDEIHNFSVFAEVTIVLTIFYWKYSYIYEQIVNIDINVFYHKTKSLLHDYLKMNKMHLRIEKNLQAQIKIFFIE